MPRPTGRGIALLGLAAGTYLAGRVVGTWELYLLAFAFAAMWLLALLLVGVAGRRIQVMRKLEPSRPVEGDEPEYTVVVVNRSWLPGLRLVLRSPLTTLGAGQVESGLATLAPRATQVTCHRLPRVNRGVHTLPSVELRAEDPLGVMRISRGMGEALNVTVYPRLVVLRSCLFFPESEGHRDWADRRGLPSPGASEFRSVRPHQPGEPLSRIDWKSTAKTGILMLREMEDDHVGADITVLLDGTQALVVGTQPHSNYELAVRVAGSIADFALRSGRAVNLILHERVSKRVVLTPDGSGRRTLLETLAAAQPTAMAALTSALSRLFAGDRRLSGSGSAILVSLTLDQPVVRTLADLRDHGIRLVFVYVSGPSFAGRERPVGSGRAARVGAPAPQSQLPFETRALLLALSAAGIPTLSLARGDDLAEALSGRGRGRRRPATATG